MSLVLASIIDEATNKFGAVESVVKRDHKGDYVLLIKRDEPAKEAFPYMTITGYAHDFASNLTIWQVSFAHGHYDFNQADAQENFLMRIAR